MGEYLGSDHENLLMRAFLIGYLRRLDIHKSQRVRHGDQPTNKTCSEVTRRVSGLIDIFLAASVYLDILCSSFSSELPFGSSLTLSMVAQG